MSRQVQGILCCTDFSQASLLSLEASALLAKQNGATVTLLHVLRDRSQRGSRLSAAASGGAFGAAARPSSAPRSGEGRSSGPGHPRLGLLRGVWGPERAAAAAGDEGEPERRAVDELERWADKVFGDVEHVRLALVSHARPAQAIVEYARDEQTDLIVMATRGRRPLRHAISGSVAERVVRSAPCPVLTLRSRAPN